MNSILLIAAILVPTLAGAVLSASGRKHEKHVRLFSGIAVLVTSCLIWAILLLNVQDEPELIHFTDRLVIVLRLDGLGRLFLGIIGTLWPMTVLYGFEYLKDDRRQRTFFGYFLISYGITAGIALAGNAFTMYCFYELLTLATAPLVMHSMTRPAVRAAKVYFAFSLGGAAFGFLSVMFLIYHGADGLFTMGGMLQNLTSEEARSSLVFFLLGFHGFGVKAALFPTDYWLPKASVAPTPVTALLHAVAVVKAGAFAIIRLVYYAYGTALLRGTFAQTWAILFAAFTIVYGSCMALKETHWKRRLAYSTVSNLSYILFGAMLMSSSGLAAALLHMAFHAEIKILAFFCAGAVLHCSGREFVRDLNGLGKRMPVTFACFTVSALALTGIPPFSGFVSKWNLLTAAADSGTAAAYIGAGAILISALLTAVYMLTAVRRAWFPDRGSDLGALSGIREANWRMTVPMILLAAGILITGLCAQPIASFAARVAAGLF